METADSSFSGLVILFMKYSSVWFLFVVVSRRFRSPCLWESCFVVARFDYPLSGRVVTEVRGSGEGAAACVSHCRATTSAPSPAAPTSQREGDVLLPRVANPLTKAQMAGDVAHEPHATISSSLDLAAKSTNDSLGSLRLSKYADNTPSTTDGTFSNGTESKSCRPIRPRDP